MNRKTLILSVSSLNSFDNRDTTTSKLQVSHPSSVSLYLHLTHRSSRSTLSVRIRRLVFYLTLDTVKNNEDGNYHTYRTSSVPGGWTERPVSSAFPLVLLHSSTSGPRTRGYSIRSPTHWLHSLLSYPRRNEGGRINGCSSSNTGSD